MSSVLDEDGVLVSSISADNYKDVLSDLLLLNELVASINKHARIARINRQQVVLLLQRVYTMHALLNKLPNPRPTPQMLTVVRASDFLIQQMCHDAVWPDLLREKFTCSGLFEAVFARLKVVWRLHSTEGWDRENKAALAEDEVEDAQALLECFQPTSDDVNAPQRASVVDAAQSVYADAAPAAATPDVNAARRTTGSADMTMMPTGERNVGAEEPEHAPDMEDRGKANAGCPCHIDPTAALSALSPSTTTATVDDICAYYRRRQLSSWKVPFESLVKDTQYHHHQTVPQFSYQSAAAAACAALPRVATRFAIRKGLLYHDRPVVVKELEEPEEYLNPATITSFVQDAVVRAQWCHPGLVQYSGAYTEKFSRCEHCSTATAAVPRLALGLVMEDVTALTASPLLSQKNTKKEEKGETRNTNSSDSPPPPLPSSPSSSPYTSLHELLFLRRHRFSVVECIDITLNVADAVQFILLDRDRVPEEVVTAWLSIAPSNLYVAGTATSTLTIAGSMQLDGHTLSETERGQVGRVLCSAAKATARAKPNVPPLTHVSEGVRTLTASLPSPPSLPYGAASSALDAVEGTNTRRGGRGGGEAEDDEGQMVTTEEREQAALHTAAATVSSFFLPHTTVVVEGEGGNDGARRPSSPSLPRSESSVLYSPRCGSGGGGAQDGEDHFAAAPVSRLTSTSISPVCSSSTTRKQQMQRVLSTSFFPVIVRGTYEVKYAPPLFIEGGPYSRWRPHPKANSPVCYALAQLLLALLTNTPPYRRWRQQSELRDKLFEPAGGRPDGGSSSLSSSSAANSTAVKDGLPSVKASVVQGHALPSHLPEVLRCFCVAALSLSKTDRPMSLQECRETLWKARDVLCAQSEGGTRPLDLSHDRVYGTDNTERVEMEQRGPSALLDDYGEE